MRRMLPLILALLLLTACGAPAAEATPSASPVPASPLDLITPGTASVPIETVSPERASSRAVPETMTLPDAGFEPESYWFAEPFGDGGQALLLMSGDGRFKCWYDYWFEYPDTGWKDLVGGSFTEAEAAASVAGGALTLADAGEHHTFYGGYLGYMGTWDTDDDWRGGDVIMVSDGWTITRFILDENGTVYKIEFWNSAD